VPQFYSPDGFHPGSVGQGILGNTILNAFKTAYSLHYGHLRLTDQQILDDAGISHPPGRSYFDVSPYILFTESDDSSGHHHDAPVHHAHHTVLQELPLPWKPTGHGISWIS
jgi:hypothetical protein